MKFTNEAMIFCSNFPPNRGSFDCLSKRLLIELLSSSDPIHPVLCTVLLNICLWTARPSRSVYLREMEIEYFRLGCFVFLVTLTPLAEVIAGLKGGLTFIIDLVLDRALRVSLTSTANHFVNCWT